MTLLLLNLLSLCRDSYLETRMAVELHPLYTPNVPHVAVSKTQIIAQA